MSNWHSMEVDRVLKELNTDPHQGLSAEEARSRLEKYGYNELKRGEKRQSPFWTLKNTLLIILLIVTVLSILASPKFGILIHAYLTNWFR